MIKFLCQVFPDDLRHHFGVVFTHYDHENEVKYSTNKYTDPKEYPTAKYLPQIIGLIKDMTKKDLSFAPPVFFLDSYVEDDDSKDRSSKKIDSCCSMASTNNKYKEKLQLYVFTSWRRIW